MEKLKVFDIDYLLIKVPQVNDVGGENWWLTENKIKVSQQPANSDMKYLHHYTCTWELTKIKIPLCTSVEGQIFFNVFGTLVN